MSNLIAVEYNLVEESLTSFLDKGGEPGVYCGYELLNKHYTHKRDGCTDWTGFPGSGKTYFCLQVLINLAHEYGQRSVLYVPDIGNEREVLAKIIKMHTGKDFDDKYGNKISQAEMYKALNWVMHHFIILKKKDIKKGISPIDFWEFVCGFKDDAGVVQNGLIDSWKNMEHLYSGREDSYLDTTLSVRNELSETYGKHFHTIAHAVKTELEKDLGPGKRRIPTAWDIKGGGSWYANGKNIITVDFPDKRSFGVDLYISKVKPENVGVVGNIVGKVKLEPKKGQYYEVINHVNYLPFQYKNNPPESELEFGTTTEFSTERNKEDLPF